MTEVTDLRAALEVCARERGGDTLRLPYDGPDGVRRMLVGRRSATAALERSVADQAAEIGLRIFGRRACPHRARVECFDVVGGRVPTLVARRSLAMLEIPQDLAVPDPRARSLHRRVVLCSEQRSRLRRGRITPAQAVAFEVASEPRTWPDARLDDAIAVWAATVAVIRVAGPLALASQLGTFPSAPLHRLARERDHLLAWLVLSRPPWRGRVSRVRSSCPSDPAGSSEARCGPTWPESRCSRGLASNASARRCWSSRGTPTPCLERTRCTR